MKSRIFVFLLAMTALASCKPEPMLSVSPTSISFDQRGGSQTISVTANYPWTASASGSGLSVSPSSGEGNATVVVTAAVASSPDASSGTIRFSSEGLSASVSVTQEARSMIQADQRVSVSEEGGALSIDVKYNVAMKVEVEASAASWLKFVETKALSSGKLQFEVLPNESYDVRTARVTVSDAAGKADPVVIAVEQAATKVLLFTAPDVVPAEGGDCKVPIQCNTEFKVTVKSGAEWIKYNDATKALSSRDLHFSVAPNETYDERAGLVVVSDVTGKAEPLEVVIVQEARKGLIVSEPVTIPSTGGSYELEVKHNVEYTAEVSKDAASWISVVSTKGLSDGKIGLCVAANDTYDDRAGLVTVKAVNGEVDPVEIVINQRQKNVLIIEQPNIIPREGGMFAVVLYHNTEYTVSVDKAAESWIKYIDTKAVSAEALDFYIEPNEDAELRSGRVVISDVAGEAPSVEVIFVQECNRIIQVGEIGPIDGDCMDFEVDIKHNVDLKVKVERQDYYWSLKYTEEDGKLKFHSDYNFFPARTAKVILSDRQGRVEPVEIVLQQGETKFRRGLVKFYEGLDGDNWVCNAYWCTDEPFYSWYGVDVLNYSPNVERPEIWLHFANNQLRGSIPDCFDLMSENLAELSISEAVSHEGYSVKVSPLLKGSLPPSFSSLKYLESLQLSGLSLETMSDCFSGLESLKKAEFWNCAEMTGNLPPSLGALPNIEEITVIGCAVSGGIPEEWCTRDKKFFLRDNRLGGDIPVNLFNMPSARQNFWNAMGQQDGYGFDLGNVDKVPGYYPTTPVKEIGGEEFTFDEIITNNKYTLELIWADWCYYSQGLIKRLAKFYNKYHKEGFEVIGIPHFIEEETPEEIDMAVAEFNRINGYGKWPNLSYTSTDFTMHWDSGISFFSNGVPEATVYDSKGNIVFSWRHYTDTGRDRFDKLAYSELIPFLESLFGPTDEDADYESTDYSQDGEVMTLQKATVGDGINVVFMGDGYTDHRMGKDGLYETLMREAAKEFFAIEPYKSLRDRFNVYAVKVVSRHGSTGAGYDTALGTKYGYGTHVEGDDAKCFEYASKVPSITRARDLLVVVLCRSDNYSGTCSMHWPNNYSVAYVSTQGDDRNNFGRVLRHEAGGHGFAFLADEYYSDNTTMSESSKAECINEWESNGWWANVDFTNVPEDVKWSKFLYDDRYKSETGIYEGACTFRYGVYKPTEDSMMNNNIEYFNAPSREAIFKRIMELSGDTYNFENFASYDAVNRKAGQSAARPPLKAAANRKVVHTAPPVVHHE